MKRTLEQLEKTCRLLQQSQKDQDPRQLSLEDPEYNSKALRALMENRQSAEIGKWKECPLWKSGNVIFLTDLERTTINYMVSWQASHGISGQLEFATQVGVWTNFAASEELVRGLSGHIIVNHVLKLYQPILSDTTQTPEAHTLWHRRTREALKLGYEVFFYDAMTGKLSPIICIRDYFLAWQRASRATPYLGRRRFLIGITHPPDKSILPIMSQL